MLAGTAALLMFHAASAEEKADAPPAPATPVYTRAEVRSFFDEANGKSYIRLKLAPHSKIPFSTQSFLVPDRSWLAGLREGASVKFTAQRIDGENTLTSIHLAEPCRRFQACD
jgi:Cu/Ag efflux protein CusF